MRTFFILVVLVLSLLIGFFSLTRGHVWGDDFASYILQADSILHGTTDEFVERNSFTIFESSSQIGPVAYPWGYPLILTPLYALRGVHPLTLKLAGLFFFAGFLICLYIFMKERFGNTGSLLIVSLFAFNPLMIRYLDQILSDIPFLFFSTLALWLMSRAKPKQARDVLLLGSAIAAASFIRTTGILLLASFLLVEALAIFRNKAEPATMRKIVRNVVIVAGTVGIVWLVYFLIFPGGEASYFAQYQDFQLQTAVRYSYEYAMVFQEFFGTGILWKILYLLLLVFFFVGLWIRRRQDLCLIVFFVLWMLSLITWPSWQGPRFIFPLLPIFLYFTFQGMKFGLGRLPFQYARVGRQAFTGFWVIIIGAFFFQSAASAYTNLQNDRSINGPFDPVSREVYDYIQEETPAESVIVFFKPRAMRLMTGHNSLMSMECAGIRKGDYLVLSRKVGENNQIPPEQIDVCNLPLNEVLRNNRFIVYEIQK
jgi:4-amino-4-deoxy-L-arabinose transferase-like glycosyltransferase